MKQILNVVLVAIVLFISNNLSAQDKNQQKAERTPEAMSQRHADKLKSELNLSDEQTKKIYEVNLKYNREMQAQRAEKEKQRSEKMEQLKKKKEQKNAELKKILTEDQYTMMLKNQEAKKEKMKQKGKGSREGKKIREPKVQHPVGE